MDKNYNYMPKEPLHPPSILQKAYNALKDAVPVIERLPRSQKFTLGDRLQNLLSDILDLLLEAQYAAKTEKRPLLQRVNIQLEKLRFYTRLSHDLGYLSPRQYEDFVRRHDEIGRMTGGGLNHFHKKAGRSLFQIAPPDAEVFAFQQESRIERWTACARAQQEALCCLPVPAQRARSLLYCATRKPTLLLRFVGLLLLRFADRQLLSLLFHEPPRKTRWSPFDPGFRAIFLKNFGASRRA